jgi:hypothetical protein
MKKFHILVFVLLSFVLTPSSTFACGNGSSDSCTMEMSSKTNKKDCCSKNEHSKSNKHKGCNGACGQALCSSSSSTTAVNSNFQFALQADTFNFSTQKQQFFQIVAVTSTGYSELWLIPKIS